MYISWHQVSIADTGWPIWSLTNWYTITNVLLTIDCFLSFQKFLDPVKNLTSTIKMGTGKCLKKNWYNNVFVW